jgi:hypothetical protein
MDVSSPVEKRLPVYREICCDVCGYPRIGLPQGSLCPECGGEPPVLAKPPRPRALPMTLGNQTWVRRIALGLLLLIVSWFMALDVILLMPIGRYSAPAVNVPTPKIAAVAMIERSIGGHPGALGVSGMLAVLGSALGIWILTEPRTDTAAADADWVRGALRWTTALAVGAVLGLMLAWNSVYSGSPQMRAGTLAALLGCELPVNTLLYAHLRKIASALGVTRSANGLAVCAWLIPPITMLSACMVFFIRPVDPKDALLLNGASAVLGAISLCCGIAGTVAVLRLTLEAWRIGFSRYLAKSQRTLLRFPLTCRKVMTAISSDSLRWSMVAGILLWLLTIPFTAGESLWQGGRRASGGDVPYVNFIAPKINVASIAVGRWDAYQPIHNVVSLAVQTLAVWLMTRQPSRFAPFRRTRVLASATRFLVTLATGAAVGWSLWLPARWDDELYLLHRAQILIAFTLICEVPATLLFYWYIAGVAERFGLPRMRDRLRVLSIEVGVLTALPLAYFALAQAEFSPGKPAIAVASASILMAAVLVVGLVAVCTLGEFAWALASGTVPQRESAPIIAGT